MSFVKDPRVESWIRARKLKYEFTKRRYMDIDWQKGRENQARLTAGPNGLDLITVNGYGAKMLEGENFPATVLYQPPGKGAKPWPLAGNHRGAAYGEAFPNAKTDGTEIECYVITDVRDNVMLDMAPRLLNSMESTLGFSKEERIAQARYAHETHGWPVAFAAQEFGISPSQIYAASSVEEVREEIKDIPGSSKIAPSTLQRVHAIQNPRLRKDVVRVLVEHDIKGNEAKTIIADVAKYRDDSDRFRQLGEWRDILDRRAEPKKKREKGTLEFPRQVRDTFLKDLARLAKVLKTKPTLEQLQITDPVDFETVTRDWGTCVEGMKGIANRKLPTRNGEVK